MPRKPNEPPIVCEYFTWRLFRRAGVFYADGRVGKQNLGKHSLATRDRAEALRRLRLLDLRKAVEVGLADERALQPADTLSIPAGWGLYLDHSSRSPVLGGVSPATLKRYGAVRDRHVQYCAKHGILGWTDFDKGMIEKYGNWLTRKYADRTVYFELTLLKSVNNWLIKSEKLPADAKLHYNLRKPQGTDTYCYTQQEVGVMIERCLSTTRLVWLAHVIIALAHTGLRISELAGLRWSDVDLGTGTIRVMDERSSKRKRKAGTARTTKSRGSRTIPVHRQFRTLLEGMERKPDGYVFHAQRGGRLRSRNVLHMFIHDVIEPLKERFPTPPGEIGFEHGRIHSLRHYFTSQAFLGGASEGEIKEWLGHADSKMVEHYRHLRGEDAQRKMDQINFVAAEGEKDRPADAK